tara:strand:+ start:71 stop:712 length:642 start_codon:yes stop_codon:yes gene_type:complete
MNNKKENTMNNKYKHQVKYAKTDAGKRARRRHLDKKKAQNLKQGLNSAGQPFANESTYLAKAKTGMSETQWIMRYRNREVEWEDLPDLMKKRIEPRNPNRVSIKRSTGRSLQQWADQYGLTREGVRRLHKKWGTLTDDLMKNRPLPRNEGNKAPEVLVNGLTLQQWADKWDLSMVHIRGLRRKWGTISDELLRKRQRCEPNNPWYKNPKNDPK